MHHSRRGWELCAVRARAPTRPGKQRGCKIEALDGRRALRRRGLRRWKKPAQGASGVRDHGAMADELEKPWVSCGRVGNALAKREVERPS